MIDVNQEQLGHAYPLMCTSTRSIRLASCRSSTQDAQFLNQGVSNTLFSPRTQLQSYEQAEDSSA